MQLRNVVSLVLLILSVPLQIYLMRYNREIKEYILQLFKSLPDELYDSDYVMDYIDPRPYLWSIFDYAVPTTQDVEESEIPKDDIHEFRPPHLKYRVGDVVLTYDLSIAVVVGWSIDMSDLTKEPVYVLLIENKNESSLEQQDRMLLLLDVEVHHTMIEHYFEKFDGTRYLPRDWLKKMYPKDV
ncbi:uncharacterized protein LOC126844947 [Adelges cooleyi]|uniref:uncharacterized protein LOC126844947 n=1 Tax=Adelges cooleyi TaxID=133065 RepID=UPI00217F7522|nr:uncharacterized protein LOC126844947 [Adelges cooleyi]